MPRVSHGATNVFESTWPGIARASSPILAAVPAYPACDSTLSLFLKTVTTWFTGDPPPSCSRCGK